MIKQIFPLLACFLPFTTYTVEKESIETTCLRAEPEALRKATDKYLNCISQISKGIDFSQAEAAEIISPKCKKILNGQIFTRNREDFLMDLQAVYENQGAWEVYPVDIIIAPSSNTVVLRLFIEMEKFGTYTAIVILRYDSDYLITEINEVLNQANGSYDFKDNRPLA